MAFPSVGECLFFLVFYWQQEKPSSSVQWVTQSISHTAKNPIYSKRGWSGGGKYKNTLEALAQHDLGVGFPTLRELWWHFHNGKEQWAPWQAGCWGCFLTAIFAKCLQACSAPRACSTPSPQTLSSFHKNPGVCPRSSIASPLPEQTEMGVLKMLDIVQRLVDVEENSEFHISYSEVWASKRATKAGRSFFEMEIKEAFSNQPWGI